MENGKTTQEKCTRKNKRDVEKVSQFKYLGSNITNNNISSAINRKIHRGTNAIMDCDIYTYIYRVSKLLQKGVKREIYKTLIRTAVLYGCQSWTIMNTAEGKLSVSERKSLREIFASVVWSITNNDELYILYKVPSIMKIIKTVRLKWLGHIARMEYNVPCMKIKFSQPEFSRKKRRPRLSWLDLVLKGLRTLGVKAWWKKQEIGICGV